MKSIRTGSTESEFSATQAAFFDESPPLYPWPHLLRRKGLSRLFKPREVFWSSAFASIAPRPGDRILDMGCGTGVWLDRLASAYGIQGIGVDISRLSVAEAAKRSGHLNRYACAEGSRLPLLAESFDLVLSLDVLEHVPNQSACLGEMCRALREGGRLFLWSINKRQRFTWNWWLSKLGVDIHDFVAHDPALMPEPSVVARVLMEQRIAIERIELFNAFFTLALDEAIMLAVKLFDRLGAFQKSGKLWDAVGRAFLAVCHHVSLLLTGVLNWMDRPWLKRGRSNGFLIIGCKRAAPKPVNLERTMLERKAEASELPVPELETAGVADE